VQTASKSIAVMDFDAQKTEIHSVFAFVPALLTAPGQSCSFDRISIIHAVPRARMSGAHERMGKAL